MSGQQFFNMDAEVGLLNILLLNPELSFEVTDLREYMFSASPHQVIYSKIQEMTESGLFPEYSLLVSMLTATGTLTKVGGVDYLNQLKNQIFSKDNLKEFEKQIIDSYKARSVISLSAEITKKVKESSSIDSVISSIRDTLDNLMIFSGGRAAMSLGDILKSAWDTIVARKDKPGLKGYTTGIKDLDASTTGYNPVEYWIIASRPSIGKSALMFNSVLALAESNTPVAVFEFEMDEQSSIERLVAIKTGVSLLNIRLGSLDADEMHKLSDAFKYLKLLPIYLDCSFDANLERVVSSIRKLKKQHDIKIAFIDYVQMMAERDENQTAEIGRISRTLKLLAKELNITIVLIAQLNRKVEERVDKHPMLSDLKQSGDLEQDADVVLFLYRDDYYNKDSKYKGKMEVIIAKQRNGPRGTLPLLDFDEQSNKVG